VIKKALIFQFFFFAIVGFFGFLIDTTTFYFLHFSIDYAFSRIISICTAMSFTFLLNRKLTFKVTHQPFFKSWLKYFLVNATSALINFSCFLELTKASQFLKHYFIIPLVISTFISMWINFVFSRYYVFKKRQLYQPSA